MELLKKIWAHSFKVEKKKASSLVINLILWIVGAFVASIVLWLASFLTGWIPVIGLLVGLVVGVLGGAVELYCLIGVVLSILVFLDVLKD